MADKAIGSLVEATVINDADRFVLEQSGQAKQISGATMISELAEALDGHGGIQSIDLVGGEGNVKTYRITFTDGTTYDYEVRDGESGNYAVVARNFAPYSDASGATQSIPFLSQGTGRGNGSATVSAGNYCQLKKKLGNTVCVNQLQRTQTTAETATYSGVTVSNSANGVHLSGTATADIGNVYFDRTGYSETTIPGHTYLLFGCPSGGNGNYYLEPLIGAGADWCKGFPRDTGSGVIFTAKKTNDTPDYIFGIRIYIVNGATNLNVDINCFLIDLSLWFGSTANIPSDLLSHPENWGRYYAGSLAYNTGTLVSADGSVLTSIGRNVWDEEWELGNINSSGVKYTDNSLIRSKNYIEVIPNATYYCYIGVNTSGVYAYFYDSNKSFISGAVNVANVTFTIPANARYMLFKLHSNYGTTYKNDITISLYYSGESGYSEYYPYTVLASVDTGSEELRSAGAVADEKLPSGVITRKVGVVDLGTLTYQPTSLSTNTFDTGITATNNYANAVCSRYVNIGLQNYEQMVDKTIQVRSNKIYIKDSAYSDPAAFKTAMSGVYLYYELATPTTEQGTAFAENIPCDPVGSMNWENTEGIPQGAEIFYPYDYAGTLDSVVDALPSANGTYTLKATVSSGKITYSWVAD